MITKKFSKSYDDALTQAYLFHSEFVNDQALFEAFSPKFAATYAADFMDLITTADDTKTNQDDLNMQTSITNDLDLKLESDKQHYQKLLLHVGFAWPGDDTKLKAFGKDIYDDARKMPAKMVNLLQDAYREANSTAYKTDLIAAGFIQTDITMLDTLADSLRSKLNEQQSYLRHVSTRSEERAVAFNKIWDVMTQISSASRLIFTESPAKVAYYMLYPEGPGAGPLTAPENLSVDVSTMLFTWDSVENATSYVLETSIVGDVWVQVYAGSENYVIYTPDSENLLQYRVKPRNNNGYGPVSAIMYYSYHAPLEPPTNLVPSVEYLQDTQVSLNFIFAAGTTQCRLFLGYGPLGSGAPLELTESILAAASPLLVPTTHANERYFMGLKSYDGTNYSVMSEIVSLDVNGLHPPE